MWFLRELPLFKGCLEDLQTVPPVWQSEEPQKVPPGTFYFYSVCLLHNEVLRLIKLPQITVLNSLVVSALPMHIFLALGDLSSSPSSSNFLDTILSYHNKRQQNIFFKLMQVKLHPHTKMKSAFLSHYINNSHNGSGGTDFDS